MTDLQLDSCPFCSCSDIAVLRVATRTYAGLCRACGAQGPARAQSTEQLEKYVLAQAADDWNRRTEIPAVKPLAPVIPTPSTDVALLARNAGASKALPEGGGNGKGADRVRARLQDWFAQHKTNPDKAVKRDAVALGASAATLYHVLNGKHMRQETLDSIASALDKLDKRKVWNESKFKTATTEDMRAEDPSGEAYPTIKLPNKFAPITGVNPLPALKQTPRCGSAP